MTGSWLCRDDVDRERLLDMEERLKPVRTSAMLILAIALVVAAPWIGLWTLVPLLFAAGLFAFADSRIETAERPEYLMFAAWALAEVTIAVSVAITGSPHVATTSWLAIPVVTLSARFSLRGVYLGVGVALALLLAITIGRDAQQVLDDPTLVVAPAALIIAVAILSTALMQSDMHYRGEAVVDPLTGMLNRKALVNRADELAQQSALTGQPVGVIVCDLDHFKEVNDSMGHPVGDAVLKDVAYRMRKRLRAFDLAYRIGGEEFLVLLPGAGPEETATYAEELRGAVEAHSVGGGVEMTMSFGVSGSPSGHAFDYEEVFANADAALYEAKRNGRNQVCSHAPADGVGVKTELAPLPS
jgi:diguanylate cyclase (GGDEF)-like protein